MSTQVPIGGHRRYVLVRRPESGDRPRFHDWRDRPRDDWERDLPVGTILEEEDRFEVIDASHYNWWRGVFGVMRVMDGPLAGELVDIFLQEGQVYDPPMAFSVSTWLDAMPGGEPLQPLCAIDICHHLGRPTALVIEPVSEAWREHWRPFWDERLRDTAHRCDRTCVPDILRRINPLTGYPNIRSAGH